MTSCAASRDSSPDSIYLAKRHFRAFMPQGVLNRPHVNLLAFVQVIGDSLAKVVKPETSDHPPGGIHVAAILLPKNDPRPLGRVLLCR